MRYIHVTMPILLSMMCAQASTAQNNPDNPSIRAAPPGPTCEWTPVQVSKPAGGQCGFNDIGAPNPGIFECGLVSKENVCTDHCVFIRCQEI
jgi:hypothetical protein